MVIAIVGMPGAGKSCLAEHFKKKDFSFVRFGQIVIDEVVRRGMEINPRNERLIREEIRRVEGMDVCARRALPLIRARLANGDVVVVDGLYSWSEYKTLRITLEDRFVVVAVFASRQLRYERLHRRPERPLTYEEAEQRDVAEIEYIEKGGPIAMADYAVLNDGAESEMFLAADRILRKILSACRS
jgi:dephospho-CoA kinase